MELHEVGKSLDSILTDSAAFLDPFFPPTGVHWLSSQISCQDLSLLF